MKSIPPMSELFNMAGMQLPEFLGKSAPQDGPADGALAEADGETHTTVEN